MNRPFSSTEMAYRLLSTPPRQLKTLGLKRREQQDFQRQCVDWFDQVVGFGVGIKHAAGVSLKISALVIRVKAKKAKLRDPTKRIPPLLYLPDGRPVLTDVVEQRRPSSASLAPNDLIGRTDLSGPGKATAIVRKAVSDRRLLLGCWHVLAHPNGRTGDVIEQRQLAKPSPIGELTSNFAVIALGAAGVQSDADYALVAINADVAIANGPDGPFAPQPATSLSLEQTVRVRSRKDGLLHEVAVIEGPVDQPMKIAGQWVTFPGIYRIGAASVKGDSGAPVVNAFNQLVGYVIGDDATDTDFGTHTLVQPIWPLLKAKGLRLVSSESPVLALSMSAPSINEVPTAIDTLARTLWGEARGEKRAGRVAVAWVVLNRVRAQKKAYGLTIEAVCLKPKQFSCWNANDPNLPKLKKVTSTDAVFAECLAIASDAVMNRLTPPDPTHGAKHYHTDPIPKPPKWSMGKVPSARIGRHVFFNDID
jgi:hypothetical protein